MDANFTSNPPNLSSSTTDETIQFSQEWIIGITVLNIIFAILGTFGNCLVLVAICKNNCLQTIPDLFIFNLALADLCVTAVRQPLLIYEANNHFTPRIKDAAFDVFMNISNIGNYATIICMLSVTIDRFLAIQHPFQYQQHCTKRKAIIGIGVCWITAAIIDVIILINEENGRYFVWAITTLCLLSTVAMYVHLFCIANKHQNRIVAVQPLESLGGHEQRGRQTRERKAAKTIALVVGVYILFYLPFLIYVISQNQSDKHFMNGFYWFFSFLLCNSAVNPIIYSVRNSRYRRAFVAILGMNRNVLIDISQGSTMNP